MVVCGLYYKTPFPVQPMKAIGAVAAVQAAQTAVVTPGAVYAGRRTTEDELSWFSGGRARTCKLADSPY
jgi:hypothetical protein